MAKFSRIVCEKTMLRLELTQVSVPIVCAGAAEMPILPDLD